MGMVGQEALGATIAALLSLTEGLTVWGLDYYEGYYGYGDPFNDFVAIDFY